MRSRKVFLASDVFIAFVDRAHPKHLHATAFFRYFAQEQFFLYTNPLVTSTVHQTIMTTISPILAKEFMKAMSLSEINVTPIEEPDIKQAFKTLLSSSSSDVSFEEALLATMADRREIPYICTVGYLHPLFGISAFYLPI